MHTLKDWAAWIFYLYEEDSRAGGATAEVDDDDEDACISSSAYDDGAGRAGSGRARGRRRPSMGLVTTFRNFIPDWQQMAQALTNFRRCRQKPDELEYLSTDSDNAGAKRRRQQELRARIQKLEPKSQAEFYTTTRLIVNVYPHLKRRSPIPHFDSSILKWKMAAQEARDHESLANWVKAEYLHRWPDGIERFCIGGSLEDIIPDYDEDEGSSSLKTIEDFFSSLLYIVRNLGCLVYCNGYDIIQPPSPAQRIECIRFQLNPFRIVLRVSELDELEIVRLPDRIVVTAATNSSGSEEHDHEVEQVQDEQPPTPTTPSENAHAKKEFQILCLDPDYHQSAIKIEVPKDGTIVIDFPVFVKGSDVWFSELYDLHNAKRSQ